MTPVVRNDWKVYTSGKSKWKEIFNSDSKKYWGTGDIYNPSIEPLLVDKKGKWYEINLHLPPLGAVILK
jgi:1,4-alpha-glucan branching enzyme